MTTLTVTAKGQVILRKNLLQHLGVEPGQKVEINELHGGRIEVKAARPAGSIDGFIGLLAGRTKKVATIDGFIPAEIAAALRALLDTANLIVNRPAAEREPRVAVFALGVDLDVAAQVPGEAVEFLYRRRAEGQRIPSELLQHDVASSDRRTKP